MELLHLQLVRYNNFLSGENSPQAEIHIPRPRKNVPPKQLKKQQKRMEKFLARKAAESAAGKPEESEERSESEEKEQKSREIIPDKCDGVRRLTGETSPQSSLPSESEEKEDSPQSSLPCVVISVVKNNTQYSTLRQK